MTPMVNGIPGAEDCINGHVADSTEDSPSRLEAEKPAAELLDNKPEECPPNLPVVQPSVEEISGGSAGGRLSEPIDQVVVSLRVRFVLSIMTVALHYTKVLLTNSKLLCFQCPLQSVVGSGS